LAARWAERKESAAQRRAFIARRAHTIMQEESMRSETPESNKRALLTLPFYHIKKHISIHLVARRLAGAHFIQKQIL
jgi:hypothetical protein